MSSNTMPRGFKFLVIFLIWGIWNVIARIFFSKSSLDVQIFNHYNLDGLLFVLAGITIILSIGSIISIFQRREWGPRMLYALFAILVIQTVFGTGLKVYTTFGSYIKGERFGERGIR